MMHKKEIQKEQWVTEKSLQTKVHKIYNMLFILFMVKISGQMQDTSVKKDQAKVG